MVCGGAGVGSLGGPGQMGAPPGGRGAGVGAGGAGAPVEAARSRGVWGGFGWRSRERRQGAGSSICVLPKQLPNNH